MAGPHLSEVGAYIKPAHGVSPAASAASTRTGSAIDRLGYHSCVLSVQSGATSGSPTSFTLDAKLQDSADGSTDWTDIADAAITALTAADSTGKVHVDLAGARRYVRVSQTIAFVGGTAPTLGNAAQVILGGPSALPAE